MKEEKIQIGILILAAGASRRMGQPKQLLEYHGRSLLNRIIDIARQLGPYPVTVTLGAHADPIVSSIAHQQVQVVFNPDWDTGMGSSIKCGLKAVLKQDPGTEAVLILLVDQPYVTTILLQSFLSNYQTLRKPVTAASYNGTLGVPAIFDRQIFPELLKLDQQVGARKVIAKYKLEAATVPFPEGGIDLDTPDDWLQFSKA